MTSLPNLELSVPVTKPCLKSELLPIIKRFEQEKLSFGIKRYSHFNKSKYILWRERKEDEKYISSIAKFNAIAEETHPSVEEFENLWLHGIQMPKEKQIC